MNYFLNKQILMLLSCMVMRTLTAQEDEYIIKTIREHKGAITSVGISPDQKYILTGGDDKLLLVIDMSSLEVLNRFSDNYYPPRGIKITLQDNFFVGSGPDIKLADLNNKTLMLYEGNTTHILSVDYGPERNIVTAGSFDYKIKVWDVNTARIELTLEGHQKATQAVAISPDEKYIVTGSQDKTVKVWNAQTGEVIRTIERHSDNITDVEFLPGGRYFASASLDKTVRLWDLETGEIIKTYAGHDKGILDIEFTPDGNHLLSASLDGSIRMYEVKTGKMVYTFAAHEGPVTCIAISPDGYTMLSGGSDGKIIVWNVSKKIFVEYAFYDEFHQEKDAMPVFRPKGKGEKNQEYDERMLKAAEKENEIVEKYYHQYISKLKGLAFN
jgi:WD40 repeat protein